MLFSSPTEKDSNSTSGNALTRSWLWYLPLLLSAVPVWLAVQYTCRVPKQDLWDVVSRPYFAWQDGGAFSSYLHSPGNNSRHDIPKFIHWLLVENTHWNLVMESLVCVFFGILTCVMMLSIWRAHPVAPLTRWGLALFSTMLLLSPMQWMNWVWGVQICYMLVVASTMAVVWVFMQQKWDLILRTLLAGIMATVAVFSFINGWLAWVLGGLFIFFTFFNPAAARRKTLLSAALWVVMFGIALWQFKAGWPEGRDINTPQTVTHHISLPELGVFLLNVMGAPFAEGWPVADSALRTRMLFSISPVIAVLCMLSFLYVFWQLWSQRRRVNFWQAVPWLLLATWGAGNIAAITVARIGLENYQPFHSRYPSYTLWFHIGLLGLLFLLHGKTAAWLRRGWLLIFIWGWCTGAVYGWWDAIRIGYNSHLLESASALRHVAPEPRILDTVDPGGGDKVPANLDRLEQLKLLQVATIREQEVQKTQLGEGRAYLGKLEKAKLVENEVEVRGWAMNEASRNVAPAVVISVQAEGQPEKWYAMATRRPRETKLAGKLKSRALENRIGWTLEPMLDEVSIYSRRPYKIKRNPLPKGQVTLRAYAFEPLTGLFYPLEGQAVLNVL